MFIKLQDLIPRAANHYQMTDIITATTICHKAKDILKKILPGESEMFAAPKSFKDHILTIGVKDSMYAQEVMMRRVRIIAELNTKLGKNMVKDVRIRLISQDSLDEDMKTPLD